MKKKLLIYGAGAIGRGYLPWVFSEKFYDLYYVDVSKSLISDIKKKKYYQTFKISNNKYISKKVFPKKIYLLNEEIDFINNFDLIITCVGTRQVKNIVKNISFFKKDILCLENDPDIVDYLKKESKKKNIYFGIPDVITSNTASKKIKKINKLNLITEDGLCFIDRKLKIKNTKAIFLNQKELRVQWLAKFYIHNSSHCIAAYLGNRIKNIYVHEALQNTRIKKVIKDCILELSKMLIKKYSLDKKFTKFYGSKEFKRFSNKLLFDPISRVAREPFRKLQRKERLIGAANECLSVGIKPNALAVGILSAIQYKNIKDEDSGIKILRKALDKKEFLKIILNLQDGEPLHQFLLKNWESNSLKLNSIKNDNRK